MRGLRRLRAGLLLGVVTGLLGGCAQVPITRYYTFDPDLIGLAPSASAPAPVTLAIGAFEAENPYQHDRIVSRSSPYEVGFSEYHRWLRPLPELVQRTMVREAGASGLFARVHGQAFQAAADYILIGTITMFDRWDSLTPPAVRIRITYQLLDAEGDRILWMDSIASTAPVAALDTATATVQSFETALHINLRNALETVSHVVSRRP